ncbi:MAG: SET domain-containing protein [Burkholderiaceae bacterium]
MSTSAALKQADPDATPYFAVRDSQIHGKGVFATRTIPAGAFVIEYTGEVISSKQAVRRYNPSPDNPTHTFYFSLESGKVIDGGNDARWINHACEPNCEAREEDGHIFIYALRDIDAGEELNYDYGLVVEERYTPAIKRAYECRCGTSSCRHTMLAPKRRKGR